MIRILCLHVFLLLPWAELLSEQEPPRPSLQPCLILTLFLLAFKAAGIAVQRYGCCVCNSSMHIEPLHSISDALYDSCIDKLLHKALQPCSESFTMLYPS